MPLPLVYLKTSHRRHLIYGALAFVLVLCLGILLAHQQYLIQRSQQERTLANRAMVVQANLEALIKNCQSATRTLAFMVEKLGVPENFDEVAMSILNGYQHIDAIELVQGGTITHIYPLEGNEDVIGYNVLADSSRNKEAFKALREKTFFMGGPFRLKQGGLGVVGRYPIFRDRNYVGMTAVVVRFSEMIRAAGMEEGTQTGDFLYQFSKSDPSSGVLVHFLPELKGMEDASRVKINIVDGDWTLHILPANPVHFLDNWALILLGFFSALLTGFLIVHLLDEPGRLSFQVAQKTADLKEIAWMQSHRVRAPLARILAITQLLKPGFFDVEKDMPLVDEIKKSAEELDVIIRDIVKRTEEEV